MKEFDVRKKYNDLILEKTDTLAELVQLKALYPSTLSLPDNCYISASNWNFTIIAPYSLPLLNEIKEELGYYDFQEVSRDFSQQYGHLDVNFVKATGNKDKWGGALMLHITVRLDATREGATCKLVEVGKREVPVYETQCLNADGSVIQELKESEVQDA